MLTGRITRLVEGKMFGFINRDNTDYFFHKEDFLDDWNQMKQEMRSGQMVFVSFEQGHSNKGPRARNVRMIDGE